ncbi:hypothetical protein DYE50_06910 [Treponema ruminis]|uniref:Uncharacterized protein n=1 Tax=Treponema ruminis TaxID=744515 RepID=A0A7W8G842_9SPIR|nr:hypothetical protein [Treponema ruminis]MBB5225608.1 hypothetical protein [Treponema ruminis]QSI02296.1 hypothetical protein DYE50_06910 [Treponema ruminis]
MEKSELTGIERQLVLEYLMDGNAPVTLTLIKEESSAPSDSAPISAIFPVALRAEQLKVLNQGIILLKNVPESASVFLGQTVKVQFYFNKLALYFVTKVQRVSAGFALVIPSVISKVPDKKSQEKSGFAVVLFYKNGSKSGQKIDIHCDFDERFPLFVRSDFKKIVDRYLSEKKSEQVESIADRIHAPKVIYLDSRRIVFAAKKTDMSLTQGCEYALLLRFPIAGPIKERKVYLTCIVDEMFENYECNRLCACAKFSSIREEDERFLSDKIVDETKSD